MRQVKLGEAEPQKPDSKAEYVPFSFEDDPGSNNSGFYELKVRYSFSLLTITNPHFSQTFMNLGCSHT